MAKSPSEQVRDLTVQVGVLTERVAAHEREAEELKQALRREAEERKAADEKRRDEISQLRRENDVLRQQFQDHVAQYQERDRRQWQLFVLVIGAALSLATGLIVTLVRK